MCRSGDGSWGLPVCRELVVSNTAAKGRGRGREREGEGERTRHRPVPNKALLLRRRSTSQEPVLEATSSPRAPFQPC